MRARYGTSLLVLLLLLLLAAGCVSTQSRPGGSYHAAAERHAARGDLEGAAEALRLAAPWDAARGALDAELGLMALDAAARGQLAPAAAQAVVRGLAANHRHGARRARPFYAAASAAAPDAALPHLLQGIASFQLRLDVDALASLQRAIVLDSTLALAYVNRGNVHRRSGDAESAQRDYDRAIGLDPELAVAWFNRGHARGMARDYDAAADDFRRAAELAPRDGAAHFYLGHAHLRRCDGPAALRAFEAARELGYRGDFSGSVGLNLLRRHVREGRKPPLCGGTGEEVP